MKVSVILPARNEAGLIKQTLKSIHTYLLKSGLTFEILVVINGSTDDTEKLVIDYSRKYKEIQIHKSKAGYGYALRTGLRVAKGDYIIIYNVDFYDLRLIDLVKINLYGRDLIIGSKRAHWSEDFRPLKRKIISSFYNLYLMLFFGFKGSDTHGIKALKKSVVSKILPLCKTYSGIFDTEFVIRCQKSGLQIADFPVIVREMRTPRFTDRLLQTPKDMIELTLALTNA